MIITENGFVKEDATVEITAAHYAHLVKLADRYYTIKSLAFKKAGLNWRNEIELNGEDVCQYIKFIEQEKTAEEEKKLREKKEQIQEVQNDTL